MLTDNNTDIIITLHVGDKYSNFLIDFFWTLA